jgi:single-stranded-DNA-specific exonuclease
MNAYLGIERSLSGKRWRARLDDDRAALALAQRAGVPEIVARVLAGRGVEAEQVASFLAPRLRDLLPDPSHLKDMDAAAARIVAALRADEQIAIFGDYDVDGATSAALLRRFLVGVGGRVIVYIPDRLKEGYGPNAPALLRLKERGAGVAITVDCGTIAHEPLARAKEAGLDVIVVDHHLAEPKLPAAVAVINPNRIDEGSPHRQLAAVGVAFLLAVAVNRDLRKAGLRAASVDDLLDLLDLVALGTVCDVVPLIGLNRAFVSQGLKVAVNRRNLGLATLADVARANGPCSAYHLGFLLGPRVNAGGRVGEADLGARLLSTDDPHEARSLAERLDRYNTERQAIEAEVLAAADRQAAAAASPIVFAAGDGWHAGVIGIVAGRLREAYERPACVVAFDGDIGRGSGRSANGLDLGAVILAARQAGLLINGGGHKNAAGFTVARSQLDALKQFLVERVGTEVAASDLRPTLGFDGALVPGAATLELVRQIERCGPFGAGNAEPRFAVTDARVFRAEIVGERHVRCILSGTFGGRVAAIAFRAAAAPLGQALLDPAGAALHVAGRFRIDNWQGEERLQLQIDDAARPQTVQNSVNAAVTIESLG